MLHVANKGIVFTTEDWQSGKIQLEADMYNEGSLGDNLSIVTPKVFHYYINHSCDPNVIDITRRANSTQYIAARLIGANEELTADYYDETTLEVCACNSPHCRWTRHAQ